MKPTHLDLFSGLGGFSLGAEWAGFQTIAFSEIDPYACAVLKKHWPKVPNLGDIRTADVSTVGPVDLLTGGFPCQPHSVAGKRRGKHDDRYLWPAMLNVIAETRPTWVVGENVAGIIGMELDACLDDLEALGYGAQPLLIPACAVGADHRRDRVWIIAHANSLREQQPERSIAEERGRPINGSGSVAADIMRPRLQASRQHQAPTGVPASEPMESAAPCFPGRETYPALLREVHGISRRMDRAARIRCLGNSIVPQIAFEIIRSIRALI